MLEKRIKKLEQENQRLKAKAKFSSTKVVYTTLPESFVTTKVAPKSQLAAFPPVKSPAKTPEVKEPTATRPGTFAKPVVTYAQVAAGQLPAPTFSVSTTTPATTSVAASPTPSEDKAASITLAAKTELSSRKKLATNDLRHKLQGGSGNQQPLKAAGGNKNSHPRKDGTVAKEGGSANQQPLKTAGGNKDSHLRKDFKKRATGGPGKDHPPHGL